MDTIDMLRQARDRIATHGLWQSGRCQSHNGTCAMLALADTAVAAGYKTADGTVAARLFLAAIGLDYYGHIPRWNDAPERTKDDVLAAFDRAIAIEEARRAEHSVPVEAPPCVAVAV